MISFKVTKTQARLIDQITERAVNMAKALGLKEIRAMTMNMDITACHANGCELDLLALLQADDFNFSHDVFGIYRHIDRKTGKLGDCFVPRFSAP